MLKIELIPDLTHCIETVAKREHADVLKQLLASGLMWLKLCRLVLKPTSSRVWILPN